MARSSRCFDPPDLPLIEGGDVELRLDAVREQRPGPHGLRPRHRQPAGSRGIAQQVVHRADLQPHPGLRAGRRSRRPVQPSAAAPAGWRSDMELSFLDLRRPAARRRHPHRQLHARRAPGAARAAGRHLRRPAVHHDRARRSAARRSPTPPSRRGISAATPRTWSRTLRDACERTSRRCCWWATPAPRSCCRTSPARWRPAAACPFPVSRGMLAYSRKENWGASETFLHPGARPAAAPGPAAGRAAERAPGAPSVNLLGPSSLGFRCRDDVREITRSARSLGVDVNVVAPLGASPPRPAAPAGGGCQRLPVPGGRRHRLRLAGAQFQQPTDRTVPIGVGATGTSSTSLRDARSIHRPAPRDSRLPWYSRSVDSTYLTGKRVFIFGDATHAVAAARIATEELASTSSASAPTPASRPASVRARRRNWASRR
jgi:hypothetical protein